MGEALEARGDANPAELAYHFFEGRAPEAKGYALAAAEQAAAALAYEEAAEHYRRAGDELPTLLALGAVELRAGDPGSRVTFATAAARARTAGARGVPPRGGRGAPGGRPGGGGGGVAGVGGPPPRGGRRRPQGDRPARGGARRVRRRGPPARRPAARPPRRPPAVRPRRGTA